MGQESNKTHHHSNIPDIEIIDLDQLLRILLETKEVLVARVP